MQIPETPPSVAELDLMKRLDSYASGAATWNTDGSGVGSAAQKACRTLNTNLVNLTEGLLAYILDRVTSREMEMFTMHDRVHGRKVAHLMWHILKPAKREQLTPPEIGMLVVAAHLHDLGMGLSPSERADRLKPESDLWDRLEIQDDVRTAIQKLREQIGDEKVSEHVKKRATQQLSQAEEALLTQDTRERHATRERYEEILGLLAKFHQKDPTRVPDIEASLSFDGDSFRDKLIDICMSHNEDADALVANDEKNLDRPRFPKDYPVGACNADLHTVAAALRLADILDFDRERTPAVLFHYLLPTTLGALENRSVLEWSKHLAISNWHVEGNDIVFRGRSQSHIIHHAVVQFCGLIADELKATHATFSPLGEENWPFALPLAVKADIHEQGYRYVPYKFELDDERVYSLLMGGAIYGNPLVAVRELVQNAVDACKLRDSLTQLYEEYAEPGKEKRIFIRYEEPTDQCPYPKLSVRDTGTGMDAYTLERYFLQVGRSYYNSSDFNQFRVQLRKRNLDFAPVSEFGIGFLSTFLLADHVEVETAMWESPRGDTAKRILKIDGPTRLIRLDEQQNEGVGRYRGTSITLYLAPKIVRGTEKLVASWEDVKDYLIATCQDLPYRLNLEYVSGELPVKESIDALPLTVRIPSYLRDAVLRIPVDDKEFGLEGEIVLINDLQREAAEKARVGGAKLVLNEQEREWENPLESTLLRGGFNIGRVGGLPEGYGRPTGGARLRLTWATTSNKRYIRPSLARDRVSDGRQVEQRVLQLWLTYLLQNVDALPPGQIYNLHNRHDISWPWLEEFSALTIYKLARQDWELQLMNRGVSESELHAWEEGEGQAIWYPDYGGLLDTLLDLVMPRVAELEVRKDGTYIKPPRGNWRAELENCRDYVQRRVDWGLFVAYEAELEGFLCYAQYSFAAPSLNARYKNLFASWERSDLINLIRVATLVANPYSDVTRLDASDTEIFRRAVAVAGDLMVGSSEKTVRLNDIQATESPQ